MTGSPRAGKSSTGVRDCDVGELLFVEGRGFVGFERVQKVPRHPVSWSLCYSFSVSLQRNEIPFVSTLMRQSSSQSLV